MLKLTRTGIGLLTRQYRSVLKKCWMINVGLWQAMGDAVSKAVSVPARLVASLLSGGALNGEAFNALDEILLSRLFERKLASLTAIGLTIAAVAMPSEAEAGVLDILNTGNETWTQTGSSEQQVQFNENTKTATGTIGINTGNAITYYTYTYTVPSNYASSNRISSLTSNVTNKYFYNQSATTRSGAIYTPTTTKRSITADFIKNHAEQSGGAIGNDIESSGRSVLGTVSGNFIGNYVNTSGQYGEGGAVWNFGNDNSTIDTINGDFIDNGIKGTAGDLATGGAIYNKQGGTIGTINGNFVQNYIYISSNCPTAGGAIFSAIDYHGRYAQISSISGNFIGNYSKNTGSGGSEGGAISNGYSDEDLIGNSIGTISGNFISNYVQSTNDIAYGGAIFNNGTITNITGDFNGNTATSTSGIAEGGAIYNSGTISFSGTNTFTGNYVTGNTSSSRGGAIYNVGTLNFSGTNTFTNNKHVGALNDIYNTGTINITGGTTTLNSGITGGGAGALNISSGAVFDLNENNDSIRDSYLGVLTNSGTFRLGLDIQHPTSGTTGTADLFTIASGSSGSILIDAINEIGGVAGRPTRTGTYTYQVLSGSGVTLALDTALKNAWASRKITTGSTTPDTIAATTNWGTTYYYRTPYEIINGALNINGNNLVYTVSSINPGEDLEKMGDTLALVTTATNNASRIFSTTDATAEYLLSTNLGAVNAVYKNLSINGTVSGNNRSTLNLGNYNGFVLDSSDDNLSLNNVKVSGGTDYSVNLANSGSNLNVSNVIMDSTAAPIVGSGNATFTGTNEINTKVLNTGTTTISSGTTDFNDEVAGFTVSAPATVSIAADDITAETTNNGTLELEGGTNIDTPKILSSRLLGAGKLRIMNSVMLGAGNSATTGQLYFGDSSDYVDSILTSSSAASTSDHALVTAGYLDNNYYMNYGDSMAKSFIKAANDNNKNVIVRSAKHDVTIFGRQSDNTATTTKQAA